MSKIKKRTPKFDKFEKSDASTNNYTPPTQIVKIPDGDKGYGLVSAGFNSQTVYFKPGIKSVNHDLTNHDYERKPKEETGDK